MKSTLSVVVVFILTFLATGTVSDSCPYQYGYAYSLLFGSHISIPSAGWVNWDNFTFALWIKPQTWAQADAGVVGALQWAGQTHQNGGLLLRNNILTFFAGTWTGIPDGVEMPYGVWNHIAATYVDGSSKIYLNGTVKWTRQSTGVAVHNPNVQFFLGRYYDESDDNSFTGLMDEITVWNRALSQQEIISLADGRKPGTKDTEPELALYFTADPDNATHAIDISGNGRHGTFTPGVDASQHSAFGPLSNVHFEANCFKCRDQLVPSCTVTDQGASVCGDGIVTGLEGCDSSSPNCTQCSCASGQVPDLANGTCRNHICTEDDLSYLYGNTGIDCESFRAEAIPAWKALNCWGTDIPFGMLGTFAAICQSLCGDMCPGLFRDHCQTKSTKLDCEAASCLWCGSCTKSAMDCRPYCGNGRIDPGEVCDDGGIGGCQSDCSAVVFGWNCTDANHCSPICGDGYVEGHEGCEGTFTGCNASSCQVIPGYACITETACNQTCKRYTKECYCNATSCQVVPKRSSKSTTSVVVAPIVSFFGTLGLLAGIIIGVHFGGKRLSPTGKSPFERFVGGDEGSMRLIHFDDSQSTEVALAAFDVLSVSPALINFNLESSQAPVDSKIEQKLTITAGPSAVYWQFFLPNNEKYRMASVPDCGFLRAGKTTTVTLYFEACCTTVVKAGAILATSGSKLEKGRNLKHTVVPIQLQTKVTMKLDPDEIDTEMPPLGDGSFGTVYRGTFRSQDVAVKVLKVQHPSTDFLRELQFLESLRSPLVVRFVGAVLIPGRLCLVTEYIPYGSLTKVVTQTKVDYTFKLKACLDCARGMSFLHKSNVIHRDLKPDNLLVCSLDANAPVVCKLSDFGTSREICDDSCRDYTKGIGTPIYMAPETLDTKTQAYTKPADVFSFSILLHYVFTEKEPYSDQAFKHPWEIAAYVLEGNRLPLPATLPRSLGMLITRCWDQEPDKRPTFVDAALMLDTLLEDATTASGATSTS